ncbi:unnamed protein product [Hydatigera taeniaeformis]|uniref:Delta-like protein n=1 Tax=Hydatigena taeniaeformis TaxID=6205 RepID=A0A0R3WKC3_HYDTA|nr:unnamed protein product [Hydatigera taeniaeformis]
MFIKHDWNAAAGTLEVYYWNPENRREGGTFCDLIVFERLCDVFFEFCIGTQEGDCSVLKTQTDTFMNRVEINMTGHSAIPLFIKHPTPVSLNIEIGIYDADQFSDPDLIGKYEVKVPLIKEEYFTILSSHAENTPTAGPRVGIRLKMQCSDDFYGSRCENYCKSDGLSYYCSPNGERVCLKGFFGEFCNLTDICDREPCAFGATCVPKLSGRFCICNGGHYPECYPLTDPCRFSPCRNGGVCDKSSTNPLGFVCTCPKYYTGIYCEQRLSLCALLEADQKAAIHIASKMALRDAGENSSFSVSSPASVCLNGGVCVDHPTKFKFFCSCPEGWTGTWCETKIAEASLQMGFKEDSLILSNIQPCSFIIASKCGPNRRTNLRCILHHHCICHHCLSSSTKKVETQLYRDHEVKTQRYKGTANYHLYFAITCRRVSALHERNAFVYEAAVRPQNLSAGQINNENYGNNSKGSPSGSAYEQILPCVGDSLDVHRPWSISEEKETKPTPAERTFLIMERPLPQIRVPLKTGKSKEDGNL